MLAGEDDEHLVPAVWAADTYEAEVKIAAARGPRYPASRNYVGLPSTMNVPHDTLPPLTNGSLELANDWRHRVPVSCQSCE